MLQKKILQKKPTEKEIKYENVEITQRILNGFQKKKNERMKNQNE